MPGTDQSPHGSSYSDQPLVAKRGLCCCEHLSSRLFYSLHRDVDRRHPGSLVCRDAKTGARISLDGVALASAQCAGNVASVVADWTQARHIGVAGVRGTVSWVWQRSLCF